MAENLVVVLGMSNSGEGQLVESLTAQGVEFGDPQELSRFNKRCLSALGLDTASVATSPTPWQNHPMIPSLREELKRLLTDRTGIRLSESSLLAPFYQGAFVHLDLNPVYKLCVRDPIEMARSLRWQGRVTTQLDSIAVGVWLRDTLGAFEAVGETPIEIVRYGDFPDHPELPRLVTDTLKLCQNFSPERLAPLLKEFRSWCSMLAPPGKPGTQMGFAWVERGVNQVVQVPFLPTGDWQTVTMRVGAPPNTMLSGLLYGLPCQIWIRRCEWAPNRPAKLIAGPGSHLSQFEGMWRLDGAYESQQLSLRTPDSPGPHQLEIEFLLQANGQITANTANRLAERLNQCAARHLARQGS